jgi:signal transduction histidine kinase
VWNIGMWPVTAQGPFEGFLVIVGAAYAIGSGCRGPQLIRTSAFLVLYFIAGQVLLSEYGGGEGDLVPVVVWMTAGWLVGWLLNRRHEQVQQAAERTATLVASQEERTAAAVEHERSRIARELHDVVAHSLSVVVVQASAERRALSHGLADVASTDAVLHSVERTGREALVDLRRLLGLLRDVGEPASLAPQPTLGQIDGLLAQIRESGLEVRLHVDGELRQLPPGVDLTAYRIVQESLTNVLKHANATAVDVHLRYRGAHLEIDVADNGSEPVRRIGPAAPESGHGLLGMRERVTVFGGALSAGPRSGGGWQVQARLPVDIAELERA